MRLVLVITDFGSFNNFLSELSLEFLKNTENELHVICDGSKVIKLEDKYNYQISNLTFHFIPFSRGSGVLKILNTAIKIRNIIGLVKPDLVHAHFTTGIFPTILFRRVGVKYWGTFHGLGMNSAEGLKNKLLFTILEVICFIRLNRIFLVNNLDTHLLRRLGFSKRSEKYDCFGFGCDIEKFNNDKYSLETKEILREKLGIKNEYVLTFTGRFVKFKGFDLVVRTFVRLNEEFPNQFVLLLIGGKDDEHTDGLTNVEQDFITNNKSVINIGFTNDVAQYLSITDLFFFPSKKEGLPTCVMEALVMTVPVVVSDARGSNDIVIDKHNGFLIKKGENEIDNLIELITELSRNSDLLQKVSLNAGLERDRFSRKKFTDYHIDMYQKIKKSC